MISQRKNSIWFFATGLLMISGCMVSNDNKSQYVRNESCDENTHQEVSLDASLSSSKSTDDIIFDVKLTNNTMNSIIVDKYLIFMLDINISDQNGHWISLEEVHSDKPDNACRKPDRLIELHHGQSCSRQICLRKGFELFQSATLFTTSDEGYVREECVGWERIYRIPAKIKTKDIQFISVAYMADYCSRAAIEQCTNYAPNSLKVYEGPIEKNVLISYPVN